MLRVWVDGTPVGRIERLDESGTTFAYDANVPADKAVSISMPVRTASYNQDYGMLPIFDMNLPEGALKDSLRERFSKALGTFDAMDLLSVVGRSQIGRIRFTGMDETLDQSVPFQSVDEILRSHKDGDLYTHLMEQFAEHSGLSGAQPKFMIRDDENVEAPRTIKSATHIVKFWDDQHPELAANEFFCMKAAKLAGLETPDIELTDDGRALVIKRFDVTEDGGSLGFEDLCVLSGQRSEDKYYGTYEKNVFKSLKEFLGSNWKESRKDIFKQFVLNCLVRNGDAHLKNFGVLYSNPEEDPKLAPVYDVVTDGAYFKKENNMALKLGGTPRWPKPATLLQIGTNRCELRPAEVKQALEEVAEAVADVYPEMLAWFKNSNHPEVGEQISKLWQEGMEKSLGYIHQKMKSPKDPAPNERPEPKL